METKEKQETCEQKIDKKLEDRLKEIKFMLDQAGATIRDENGDSYDGLVDWLNSWALSWDGHNLSLSWGGPSDGFYLSRDNENNLVDARYYYRDWFDGAERRLEGADFELLEELYEACLNF